MVTVTFNPAEGKEGGRIHITQHTQRREYTLTAVNIAAQQIAVANWPDGTIYGFDAFPVGVKTLTFDNLTITAERNIGLRNGD
ncbi:hypothetical protein NF675_14655 [Pseudomonas siliginis]|uniref:hypothetical protein n=1 Tax=Pseudomonas siliginis TaxID=2842346 RepID=UPI002093769B|nr:hypothetical protein [Pseudomonas siliginis]UST72264.1 hypothetical protein NF675_14655 [Pseudomonas siliginis]